MRRALVAVLALGLIPLFIGSARGEDRATSAQDEAVKGTFQVIAMMHTGTAQFPNLPRTRAWDGRSLGEYGYRSIPCFGNAPVNNLSSNLPSYNGRVPGSRLPSSTRLQPFAFSVVRRKRGGLEMRGLIELVVCQLQPGPTPNPDPVPDEQKPRIEIGFRAPIVRDSSESVRFRGKFRIRGGTQRYEDLTGRGTISGNFMCLGPETCAQRGGTYFDGQLALVGNYRDPTPMF